MAVISSAPRRVLVVVLAGVLASACGQHRSTSFLAPSADLAYPDFSIIANREPVPYGRVGGGVAVHRIKAGRHWLLAFRESRSGGALSGSDTAAFTKITVTIDSADKPTGDYAFETNAISGVFSTGSIMHEGRNACYGPISRGTVNVHWASATAFTAQLQVELPDKYVISGDAYCPKGVSVIPRPSGRRFSE